MTLPNGNILLLIAWWVSVLCFHFPQDHLDEELIHEKQLIKDLEEKIRQVSKMELSQKQIQNAVVSDYGSLEKENKALAKKEAMELRLNAVS